MQMQRDEQFEPSNVIPYLKSLCSTGILSQTDYTQLLQELYKHTIRDEIEYLNYIDHALLFNLHDYSSDPHDYFPKIYHAIAQMLTETEIADINLDKFSLKLKLDGNYGEYKSYKAIVSACVNGRKYKHSSLYIPSTAEHNYLGCIDSDELTLFFNKILLDNQSSHQLYKVQSYSDYLGYLTIDYAQFGIIALTENQAQIYFRTSANYPHNTLLPNEKIEEIINLMETNGLLSHLTSTQIATTRQTIRENYISDTDEILTAFPNLVVTVSLEPGNINNLYQALINQFVSASHGAFTPTEVIEEVDMLNQTTKISFTWNEKCYSQQLDLQDKLVVLKFCEFIEQVVEQTITQGKFFCLFSNSDQIGYIFLTEEQYHVLQLEGVIGSHWVSND